MRKLFKRLKMNKKGFTLLECVTAITIIGIMSGAMMSLFSQGIKFISKAQKLDELSQEASEIVMMGNEDSTSGVIGSDGDKFYVKDIPVLIEFNISVGGSNLIQLAPKEFNFQAGVVVNTGTQTKVVYYDITPEELNDIK